MIEKPIYVTRPHMPPLEDFIPYLKQIWDSKILTNNGPLHEQLETELCKYLGVEYLSLFTNGTIALIAALKALNISGEVITTPYSFVATAHTLLWNNLRPVFVDIEPNTFNIDPDKIERAITENTSAILPVHCYGNPCAVEKINHLAEKYHLKVIYDAAHAFGVKYKEQSLLKHGDLSVLSFHATKVFSTLEGGAVICPDKKTKLELDQLKNFGFVDEVTVSACGINGKMNEVCAAFGLLQLKEIPAAINRRKDIDEKYRKAFSNVTGISFLPSAPETETNGSYFPILVEDGYPASRDDLYMKLREYNIYSRKYFYPLLSELPMYSTLESASSDNLPVANKIAKQVLCLPISSELSWQEQNKIIELIVH